MKYMHQLDAIRAIAVIAVLWHHFGPKHSIDMGEMGVSLFFVLSGFLITQILLKYRQDVEAKGYSTVSAFKKFYIRRTLRIFPIYYITLLAVFILGIKNARETIWWNISYLSNLKPALDGVWEYSIAHFWSLSVEEQFYLFWPLLIFYVPKKHLLKSIIFVILIAPISRFIFYLLVPNNAIAPYVTTFCCLDLLGFGGLLGLLNFNSNEFALQKHLFIKYGLIVGGPLFLGSIFIKEVISAPGFFSIFYRTFEAFFYVWLIGRASEGMTGVIGKILDLRALVEIGKVSYGIYLFHPFITGLSTRAFKIIGVTLERGVIYFVIHSVLSVGIAYFSWLIIEKPINSLKDRFEQKPLAVTVSI